jgi:malonate decarboxylase alpha subunit
MATPTASPRRWDSRRTAKGERLSAGAAYSDGKVIDPGRLRDLLQDVIRAGDRVALEGDNQKQADFLSRSLADCDPHRLHDLHMLISSVSRPEHLDLFERGIATKLDLAYAGPQSVRIAQMVEDGTVHIGAIHTYVELYARMFVDLAPDVVLLCAEKADRKGNLYTGPNTEDTPTIAEAAAFHDGVVIVQADEIVDSSELPRVDIPGDWVDFVVAADRPFFLEPLFTRDPRHIGPVEILKAMIAIRGVYERHRVMSLNHGVGFDTAAIELLLPTYGERLGLKGKIAQHWVLNPHPTLIPAIESGWVSSIHSFGGESGMNRYAAARPDVFFTGADGSLRSNRVLAQLAGQYAIDMFIGSSLQIDADANSSTVTDGRLSGFGGAPNMGHDPHGRRHSSPAWLDLAHGDGASRRGRKLVVQMAQTFRAGGVPTFVETLDAVEVGRQAGMPLPPVMIYGDDVSHVVTEEGVAYLYKAHSLEDRRAALAAIAGVTPIGRNADARRVEELRRDGLVAFPEDLKVETRLADRSLLAARSIEDLVAWSGGLYDPPAQFRDWCPCPPHYWCRPA